MTEDEMVSWHHQLNGHEFEQASGDGERQGNLACCSPWGHKELEMTEQLNITMVVLSLDFLKKTPYSSPQWLHQFTLPPTQLHSLLFTPFLEFVDLLMISHSDQCKVIPHWDLICISLMISNVERLFICLLANYMSSLKKCLFRSSVRFLLACVYFQY